MMVHTLENIYEMVRESKIR